MERMCCATFWINGRIDENLPVFFFFEIDQKKKIVGNKEGMNQTSQKRSNKLINR